METPPIYEIADIDPPTDDDAPNTRPIADWNGREIAAALGASAVLLALLAGLLWLLYAIVTGLLSLLGRGAHAADHTASDLVRWLAGGPITTTVTDPIRTYLDHHATGLPATPGQLWITWLVLAAALFVAAVCGSRGGRIGWCLLGALTTAMAYAGTTGHGQGIAAGLTAGIWAVLAVPAFAHGRRRGDITIVNPPPAHRGTEPVPEAG